MEALLKESQKGIKEQNESESKAAYYIEHLQRLQAEFDNYRKRTKREKTAIAERARMAILSDLLDLYDSLQRATEKYGNCESEEVAVYREGVHLILRKFMDFLEKEGVTPIEAVGHTFDPYLHEAVMTEKGVEGQSGLVAREISNGYLYKDRLLRPARVSVYQ